MKLNVQKLEENVLILEERLKRINHRLYVRSRTVRFRNMDDTDFWSSVGEIYSTNAYIKSQDDTPNKEWQAIPHELILETVKEWQEEFGKIEENSDDVDAENIPNLKINQLRLNIHGELCLLVNYGGNDDDIRAWNLEKKNFEYVSASYYVDRNGEDKNWKRHLPKVVIEDVSTLTGVAKAFFK